MARWQWQVKNLGSSTSLTATLWPPLPFFFFGFNMRSQGGVVRDSSFMQAFHNCLVDCSHVDLGYSGHEFTWTNGRAGSQNIQERLDRFLGTENWRGLFQSLLIQHLPRMRSDHALVRPTCMAKWWYSNWKNIKIFSMGGHVNPGGELWIDGCKLLAWWRLGN